MSFILDALKKSESDRQRQSGPSLFEVKVTPPRRALPVWAVAIAVLLGVNVVVVSWMLLRHAPDHTPASANTSAAAPTPAKVAGTPGATPASKPASITASGVPAAHVPAAQVSTPASAAPSPVSSGQPPVATSPAPVSPSTAPPPATSPPPASAASNANPSASYSAPDSNSTDYAPAVEPSAAPGSGTAGDAGALPLYRQIVTSDGLPPLHLDLHVFATNPKDRFAMINMQKVVEGDSLPNGVHVDAIRPDGVVLSYHGTQFLLPRD